MRSRVWINRMLKLAMKFGLINFENGIPERSESTANMIAQQNTFTPAYSFSDYIDVDVSAYNLYWPYPFADSNYTLRGTSSISDPSELNVKFVYYRPFSSIGLYNNLVAISGTTTTLPIKPFIKLVDISSGTTINTFYPDYSSPVPPLLSFFNNGYFYTMYFYNVDGLYAYKLDSSFNLIQKYVFTNLSSYGNIGNIIYGQNGFSFVTTSNAVIFFNFDGNVYVNNKISDLIPSTNTLIPIFYDGVKLYIISGAIAGDTYSNVELFVTGIDGSYTSYQIFDSAIINIKNSIRVGNRVYYVIDKFNNYGHYLSSSLMYVDLIEHKNINVLDFNAGFKTNMCLTPDNRLLIHDYSNSIMYEYDTSSETMKSYNVTTDDFVRVMICDAGHYSFILSSNAGTVKIYFYDTNTHTIESSTSISESVSELYPPMLIGKTLLISNFSENL